jgi:ABC-type transporter Mla maintaining outer membrane lipid asymmetry ATPase subunit MlaF
MDVATASTLINGLVAKKQVFEKLVDEKTKELKKLTLDVETSKQALNILQEVALQTQASLKFNIEAPVTSALSSVLAEPYQFKLKFDIAYGKTTCKLLFEQNGSEIVPKDATGGTALDLASLALRVALYNLAIKKTDNVFILDEFTKHISADYLSATGDFIKQLSESLGIQFIFVTHDLEHLAAKSDNVVRITKQNGVSITQ